MMKPIIKHIYPLSPMQAGMLFHSLKERSIAYFGQIVLSIEGELEMNLFEQAYNQLLARYDILRTVFVSDKFDQPQQVVFQERSGKVYYKDLSGLGNTEELLARFLKKDQEKGFDLAKDLLMRMAVLKTGPKQYTMIVSHHHIIMDGWCYGLIMNDFLKMYAALRKGFRLELPEPTPYFEFIAWLQRQKKDEAETYWQNYLSGYDTKAVVPARGNTYAGPVGDFETIRFTIDQGLTGRLEQLVRGTQVTINTILQAIWGILLQRYNNTDDVVFGSIVSGRDADVRDIQNMIGLFINAIPVRVQASRELTFIGLMKEIQDQAIKAGSYDYLPLAEIQAKTQVKNELIGSLYVFKNYFFQEELLAQGMEKEVGFRITHIDAETPTSYGFNIRAVPGKELTLFFDYRPESYDGEFVANVSKHFLQVVRTVAANSGIRIADIDIVPEDERDLILHRFNSTTKEYADVQTLYGLFEEQAAKTPEHTALFYEGETATYRELNRRANQVARTLRCKGVGPDTIVGIMFDRSIDMFIGMLAVLKAGGAYCPIDPGLPGERIQFMFTDSQACVLLTQFHLANKVSYPGELLVISELFFGEADNLESRNGRSDLAYVIYTSGTTGKPKGVMLEHGNAVNFVFSIYEAAYALHDADRPLRMAVVSPYIFDMAVKAIYPALLFGNTLYIVPDETRRDGEKLLEYYVTHRIDTSDGTPMHLQIMLSSGKLDTMETGVKHFIIGGEILPLNLVREFMARHKDHQPYITNSYGPTECSTDATCYLVHAGNLDRYKTVPIGKPLGNYRAYVLDKEMRLQPVGVPGEIYIAGAGVGRGYWQREELTHEKFLADPFYPGQRMYRTGDLGKWLSGGELDTFGRVDNQVKIRGYRIELGEITNQLLLYAKVKEACVMARTDRAGDKFICAYIVGDDPISMEELRDALAEQLPGYMIPAFFIQIANIPLNHNGKIDWQALPEPGWDLRVGREYVAPVNEVEEKLAEVWQEILGTPQVGVMDHFFDLGGDSIKAMRVVAKLKQVGYHLGLQDLFSHPTIRSVSGKVGTEVKMIDQTVITGEVALTPIQREFFARNLTGQHHWNQSVLLYSQTGFDAAALHTVFKKITEHHDALRMVFRSEGGRVVQVNRGLEDVPFALTVFDLRNGQVSQQNGQQVAQRLIEDKCTELQSKMNLAEGPLVQVGLFKTSEGDHLLIAVHHLLIDGISWRILLEDFAAGYTQALAAKSVELPAKTTSFKEWAGALQAYATGNEVELAQRYWNGVETTTVQPLPRDRKMELAENKVRNTVGITVTLTPEETENLLKNTHRAYRTEINDILLAALGMTFRDWMGEDRVLISLEGHGREMLGEKQFDLGRTIGWFTSRYPLILDLTGVTDLGSAIKSTKERLRRVPDHGISYGVLRYLAKDKPGYGLEPEIGFNYLGQFDQDIRSDVFAISALSAGYAVSPESENKYAFNVNGLVQGGRLSLTFIYNRMEYHEETVQRLGDAYRKNLCLIIEHCRAKESVELSPSDYGDTELMFDELERIVKLYETEQGVKVQRIYRLSPMQEGMFFHALSSPTSTMYCQQMVFDIQGKIDLTLFQESFNRMLDRHDILRTVFTDDGLKVPRQVVLHGRKVGIYYEDISGLTDVAQRDYLEQFLREDRRKRFNLRQGSLMRFAVIQTGSEDYKVFWSYHHIIKDGWATGLLMDDFFSMYKALEAGQTPELPEAPQYGEFVQWLARQNHKEAKDYWAKYLEEYECKAVVPSTKAPIREGVFEGKESYFVIEEGLVKKLEEVGRNARVTLDTILRATWGILLQRYNNVDDVVFGSVVSGRNAGVPGIEQMVGVFINTIPCRVKTTEERTVRELLEDIQANALASTNFDYCPLAEVQALTALKQELINNLLIFENYHFDEGLRKINEANSFTITDLTYHGQTNYDLYLVIHPGSELHVRISYNGALYEESFIQFIMGHFVNVLHTVADHPETKVRTIDILTENEKRVMLHDLNETEADYPLGKTMHQLFEEQVARTPDQIAVVHGGERLTFRELDERANQLASRLRHMGVKVDSIVGLLLSRSSEMVIGTLGILKAGAGFMPIDPKYPKDRIEFMLTDSQAKILLTQTELLNYVEFAGEKLDLRERVIWADDSKKQTELRVTAEVHQKTAESILARSEDAATAPVQVQPHNLCHIIYTSGSTGKPKGVMVEHASMVNYITWFNQKIQVTEQDATIVLASYSFDGVYTNFWSPLVTGSILHIITEEIFQDSNLLLEYIGRHQITHIKGTPSLYNMLVNCGNFARKELFASLRFIMNGGEAVRPGDVSILHKAYPHIEIMNHYGPTEATIGCLSILLDEASMERFIVQPVIGRPHNNMQAFIFGQTGHLQPVGIPGELCVAGVGLARGYLNRPELTRERFVRNHYTGERMYKTGDLARWLPDGTVEYLGRIDHQVKIRGYRIEPAEIENEFLKLPGVRKAVVIARNEAKGDPYLCAYLVTDEEIVPVELKQSLAKTLPNYMIPSYIIRIPAIPVTLTGKLDRRALPEPDRNQLLETYVAPTNPVEVKLAAIWQEVLGLERVGVEDNFFDLGGHSLKAILIVAQIHREFNVQLPIKELFSAPTVRGLSRYIQNVQENIYASIECVEEREYYPVSSAQRRLYTLQQFDPNDTVYNMPIVLKLRGRVQKDRLEQVFNRLAERHEALRTYFESIEGRLVQKIVNQVHIRIDEIHCTCGANRTMDAEIKRQIQEFIQPFDLSQAPLIHVRLLRVADEEYVLLYDLHHTISDGISGNILAEEFASLYEGEELPSLRIQYRDYAVWQNNLLQSEQMRKQEQYWLDRLSGELPVLNLSSDYERPAVQSFAGDRVAFRVERIMLEKLNDLAKRTESTLYMVMLAAYNVLLMKYSGDEDIIVGSPIAGRPHADLQNIIGMFVNVLALRNYPAGGKKFLDFLQEVKETALGAYQHQDYQFEELVNKLNLQRDVSRNPIFNVIFTMHNQAVTTESTITDFTVEPFDLGEAEHVTAKFDLELTAMERGEGLECSLVYSTKLFHRSTIEKLAEHYMRILGEIVREQERSIGQIDMLSATEKELLIYGLNDNRAAFSRDRTVHQLFEEWVARYPQRTAFAFSGEEVSYQELNERSNRLASLLRKNGVTTDRLCGILMDRSPRMAESILAVWKAGGAYIPLDVDYPVQRVTGILQDSGAVVLLTQRYSIIDQVAQAFTGKVIDLDNAGDTLSQESAVNPGLPRDMANLAYVIYTSGSTGKPKGAMVEHIGMMNHLQAKINDLYLTEDAVVAQNASHCFDISVWQFCVALVVGGKTVIYPNELVLDLGRFIAQVIADRVNILEVVPSFLSVLLDILTETALPLPEIRYLLVTGEAVKANLVRRWFSLYPEIKMVNAYGPTEASDDITHWIMSEASERESIPIGRPLQNFHIYIVDKDMNLCPVGVKGEICVAGVGVGRGYLNDPEKTALAFMEDPFVEERGVRLYKTGDLGRRLADGTIEFFGRKDYQVKIRGFRIEMGEIESHLVNHPVVKEAVVIDCEDAEGNKYLVAYLVLASELNIAELRSYLTENVPEYMVPAYFITLEQLPLNRNGKIDRKALPAVDGEQSNQGGYVPPANEFEERLAAIWAEALGMEKVSVTDSFFELGGHSLKATFLGSRIYKEFKILLSLNEIFQYPTVRELSRRLQLMLQYNQSQERPVALLNDEKERKVFALPPGVGYGVAYVDLAQRLETHAFYAFDFIEKHDVLQRYIKLIKEIQPEGPYILLGYSAGGNMAFELAKEMERQALKVSDVIILDSKKKEEATALDRDDHWFEDYLNRIQEETPYFAETLGIEPIKQKVKAKLIATRTFYNKSVNSGVISANIHFIKSEGRLENDWGSGTTGVVTEYQGSGGHEYILDRSHLEKNAKLVDGILRQICGSLSCSLSQYKK